MAHMGSMGLVDGAVVGFRARGLGALPLAERARAVGGFSTRGDEIPEQILKGRYARGDIDRDEYQRRLEDLRR